MNSEIQYAIEYIAYLERQRLICWSDSAIANIDRELQEEREKLARLKGENGAGEEIQDQPFRQDDPLRCADADTYNAIYNGGNSDFPSI